MAVPDPHQPIAGGGSPSPQRDRRARVLAAVRRRISAGSGAITLRSLAAECALSHQTIANLAGSGSSLVKAAMLDYVAALGQHARAYPAPNLPLAWADVCWLGACAHPRYIAASSDAYFQLDADLTRSLHEGGTRLLMVSLRQMQRAGDLRGDVDCWSIASCAAALTPALAHAWRNGAFGLPELRKRLATGTGTMLLSGATPRHADAITAWLARCGEEKYARSRAVS